MLARIKVGDLVEVVSGKHKKKRGEVIEISRDKNKVKVNGVAIVTKFSKKKVGVSSGSNIPVGGIIKKEAFIYSCKVMPICPKTDKPCRVRTITSEAGDKVRVSARSGLKI